MKRFYFDIDSRTFTAGGAALIIEPKAEGDGDDIIVLLLIGIYHIFYWQMLKDWVQSTKNERLPQTPMRPLLSENG